MIQVMEIPGWHPTKLNKLVNSHWGTAAKMKTHDREIVGNAALVHEIRPATGKRRVRLLIVLKPGQRAGDPDAYWKSLLDALVHLQILTDDNRQGCEITPVKFARGEEMATYITVEDMT